MNFTTTNWVSLLLMQAPFYAFPVVVVASLTKEQSGVFYIVWSMTSVLFMIPQLTGRVLLMEAAGPEPQLRGQAWFSLKLSLIVVAAVVLVSIPVAFLIPVVYGQAYESGRLLLILIVAGLVPFSVTNTAINFARARERNVTTAAVSTVLAACVLIPASLATSSRGSTGAATVWLLGHSVGAFMALELLDVGLARVITRPARRVRTDRVRRVVLLSGAALMPVLIAGWVGLAIGFGVLAVNASGHRRVAIGLSAALVMVAWVATLVEGHRRVSLGFAQDRPLAGAAASLAIVLMSTWAMLELLNGNSTPETLFDLDRSSPSFDESARPRVVRDWPTVAGACVVGGLAFLTNAPRPRAPAAHLVTLLEGGRGLRSSLGSSAPSVTLAPLGELLVAHGPLPVAPLGITIGAALFGFLAVQLREIGKFAPLNLLVVAIVIELSPSVYLGALLAALLVAAGTVLFTHFYSLKAIAMAGVSMGLATTASVEAIFVLVLTTVLIAVTTSRRHVLAFVVPAVVIGFAWWRVRLDLGSVGGAVATGSPLVALLLAGPVLVALWAMTLPYDRIHRIRRGVSPVDSGPRS